MSTYKRAVVPYGTTFETKTLSIVPNGRAETLIEDEDGVEYQLLEVYRPVSEPAAHAAARPALSQPVKKGT